MNFIQVSLSAFIAITIGLVVTFVVLERTTYAEYACGTYGAGNYNVGDAGTGESCTADTTTSTSGNTSTSSDTSSSTSSSSTSISNQSADSSSDGIIATTPVEGDKSITLNDYMLYKNGSGQSVDMKIGEKVYFSLGDEAHTITVKEITPEYIIFTIASTPTDVKVLYGQSVDYDVDKDGKNDITLHYKSLSADQTATVAFAAISSTETSDPLAAQTAANGTKASNLSYWWALIPGTVLVAIIVALIIRKKRNSHTIQS